MADDDDVMIESQDGVQFPLEVRVAKMSTTMENLIEDAGIENPIPLPNVTGSILAKVVEYCKYHTENPTPVTEDDKKKDQEIIPWDLEFCKVDQETLFELILAANYLDIPSLLDVTCKTVANMIRGKTPEEIRHMFNIKNDFTPEEEEQVRKENEWCEERN